MSISPSPEDFWVKLVAHYLAEVTGKAGETIGKTLGNLWDKVRGTPAAPEPEHPTLFTTPPSLPLSLTPLVGREEDFAGLLGALSHSRIVTLTGLGGVGKTALAQTIARWTWEEEHATNKKNPRGVPYIALDALTGGSELADYVRRRLLPDSPPPAEADAAARQEDAVRVIAAALNADARLLVLDNFESALDKAGATQALEFIRRLVAALADGVRILVTSRRALNLAAIEAEYYLEPLAEKYAIELFYERAEDAVSPADRKLVAEICRLEDDLPLGIELAAAAIYQRVRPLREMLEALRVTPLDVDIADALGYPERQRGLAAALRYTYDHLPTDAARRLYCAFSIFRGGADRDAVKYVDGTDDWERALRELVTWKLMAVDQAREPWRYSMLPTTYAYSALQRRKAGAALGLKDEELAQRHAEYFVQVAARFGKTPMEQWGKIEEELDNIKQGADWAVKQLETREGAKISDLLARVESLPADGPDAGLAGAYAWQLYNFVFWRRPIEGREWLGGGLIAFHRSGDKKREALMCNQLGSWLQVRGDYAAALEWYEKSVALCESLGDQAGLAATYNNIGQIHYSHGDYAAALEWYEKSVALNQSLGNQAGLAATYHNIGMIHKVRGDYAAALEWYEKSVALCQSLGDQAGLAATYNNIGMIHKARGDYAAALEWYEKSVALSQSLGDQAGLATTYNNIGMIHDARGDYAAALEWYEKSVALSQSLGDQAGLALTWHNMAYVAMDTGNLEQALDLLVRSRDTYAALGLSKIVAEVEATIAIVQERMKGAS